RTDSDGLCLRSWSAQLLAKIGIGPEYAEAQGPGFLHWMAGPVHSAGFTAGHPEQCLILRPYGPAHSAHAGRRSASGSGPLAGHPGLVRSPLLALRTDPKPFIHRFASPVETAQPLA